METEEKPKNTTTRGDAGKKNTTFTPIIYGGDQIIIFKSSSQKWTVTDYGMYVFFEWLRLAMKHPGLKIPKLLQTLPLSEFPEFT